MVSTLPAEDFLAQAGSLPVIDVRSPAEYERGHLPGAFNIPLFDNLERAEVGTLYHQAGRDDAVNKGLEIAGPKMQGYVEKAKSLARSGEVLVYCWRGGMRSESMAWLFHTAGLRARVLEKGYKGFRRYFKRSFEREQPMFIIGGMTGSGKTRLLDTMAGQGIQQIDLEHLANHKGSVFGNLGQSGQPTNEHFENLLGMAWLKLDTDRPVVMEDESMNIGRASIPGPVYDKMQRASLLYIDMPLESRVERLYREYAHFPADELLALTARISRRLGGANARAAAEAIQQDRLKDAIQLCLRYYDKAYTYDVNRRDPGKIIIFKAADDDIDQLAKEMIREISKHTL